MRRDAEALPRHLDNHDDEAAAVTLWMGFAAIMDEPTLEGTRHLMPTDEQRQNAAAILNDHVHGLHEAWDDPDVGCLWPGCEPAFWLLASLQKPGPVSIEDLLR